jgi:hypothetical protein
VLDIKVSLPGIGNDVEWGISLHVNSGIGLPVLGGDANPRNPLPMYDLPP